VKSVEDLQESINKAVERKTWSSALYFTNEKLRLCPGDKNLKLDKLEYMMDAGQTANATKMSQELFEELNTIPRYLYIRGMILVDEGRIEQGKKFLIQALKHDPDYVKGQKALKRVKKMDTLKTEAGALFKAGEYKKAIIGFSE
jgi:tetratricopeptide (TPR) repeat protein